MRTSIGRHLLGNSVGNPIDHFVVSDELTCMRNSFGDDEITSCSIKCYTGAQDELITCVDVMYSLHLANIQFILGYSRQ